MSESIDKKAKQRAQLRAQIAMTSVNWFELANSALLQHLQAFLSAKPCRALIWKAHFFGEPNLDALGVRSGIRVFYPRVVEGSNLDFFQGEEFLADGPRGILQPKPKADRRLSLEDQGLVVCFVPGLAFDLMGNRLGRGAGMYDRFIAHNTKLRNFVKVGVCWSFQIVESVHTEPQDQRVDYIVSEIGINKIG